MSLETLQTGNCFSGIDIEKGGNESDVGKMEDLDLVIGEEGGEMKRDEDSGDGCGAGGVMQRIRTNKSWKDPGPPPDGGLLAWTQVALVHLTIINTWGFVNSFGVFQAYYTTALQKPPSTISWVGSVQVFLLFFVGTIAGRLTDAGYFRLVFLVGSLLGTLGLFMASLSTQYWQLFLAQGICCGLGNGFLFCPAVTLVSTYFDKKRGVALGIAASGSATGGMLFPGIVQVMLPRVGFPWTMRTLAFIQLGCLTVCNLGLRPRVPPRKSGPWVDWESFKDVPYVLYGIGMFFTMWGVYFAFYYVSSFSRNIIGLPLSESYNLLIILNGVGTFGRIIPNYLADRYFGPLNCMIPAQVITAMLCFSWIAVSSRSGTYAWAVVYGTAAAAIQSLFPAALTSLTTDLRKAGVRIGMVFTVVSFAVLTGPPLGGLLIQRKDGGYEYADIFAGMSILVGCGFLTTARMAKSRKLWVKM